MSILSITWNNEGLTMACRPDRSTPPMRVDVLCGENVIHDIIGIVPVHQLLHRCMYQENIPDEIYEQLSNIFFSLLDHLNDNKRVMSYMMEEYFDSIAIVVPSEATATHIQIFTKNMKSVAGVDVTVLNHSITTFAGGNEKFEANKNFFLISWEEEIIASMAFSYETMRHVTRSRNQLRHSGFGSRYLIQDVKGALLREYGIGSDINAPGTQNVISSKELSAQISALLDCMMKGDEELIFPCSPMSNGSQNTIKLSITALMNPIRLRLNGFIQYCIHECNLSPDTLVVLSGSMLEFPGLRSLMEHAIIEQGLRVAPGETNAALYGAFQCFRQKTMLTYDCGIMIREKGSVLGVGTLVLIRPTAVDQERQSETLTIKPAVEATLEAVVYIRKLNVLTETVDLGILESKAFAPKLSNTGEARIRVAMRVNEPVGNNDNPTVDIKLYDVIDEGREIIHFAKQPMVITGKLDRPPVRDSAEVSGISFRRHILKARDQITALNQLENSLSVTEWYEYMMQKTPPLTRDKYWSIILDACDIDLLMWILSRGIKDEYVQVSTRLGITFETILTCTPETFQSWARTFLVTAMCILGRESGRSSYKSWYAANKHLIVSPPSDIAFANQWFNAMMQDVAGTEGERDFRQRGDNLHKMYEIASLSPEYIRVNWYDTQE